MAEDTRRMARLSYNYCLRILRKAGASQVTAEAVEELRKTIEKIALEISEKAVLFSDDEERLRVNKKDVRDALRELVKSLKL